MLHLMGNYVASLLQQLIVSKLHELHVHLHVHCICVACVLHLCCMCVASVLHLCCMCAGVMLHHLLLHCAQLQRENEELQVAVDDLLLQLTQAKDEKAQIQKW